MAIKQKPKWFNPVWITYAQISQMFVGVVVTAYSFYVGSKYPYGSTQISFENNVAAAIMYSSYLFLFLQFFVRRYFKGTIVHQSKKKSKNE